MPETPLEMIARIRDEATPVIRNLSRSLNELSRSAGMRETRDRFHELHERARPLGREIKEVLEPALHAFGITSAGVTGILGGLAHSVYQLARSTTDMRFLSEVTRISAHDLELWTRVGERLHVSTDQMKGSFQSFGSLMLEMGNPTGPVGKAKDLFVTLYAQGMGPLADKLMQMARQGDVSGAWLAVVEALGKLDPSKAAHLAQEVFGDPALGRLRDFNTELAKTQSVFESNSQAAKALEDKANDVRESWDNFRRWSLEQFGPTLTKVLQDLKQLMDNISAGAVQRSFGEFTESVKGRGRVAAAVARGGQAAGIGQDIVETERRLRETQMTPEHRAEVQADLDRLQRSRIQLQEEALPKADLWDKLRSGEAFRAPAAPRPEPRDQPVEQGTRKGVFEGLRDWFQQWIAPSEGGPAGGGAGWGRPGTTGPLGRPGGARPGAGGPGAIGGPRLGAGGANYMRGPLPGPGDLTQIDTPAGKVTVHKDAAGDIKGFIDEMAAAGAPIDEVGGYSNRNIAGSNRPSQHAYGTAVDIDQRSRNVTSRKFKEWADTHSEQLADMARRHHMRSGGDWRSPDFGHFEWAGPTGSVAAGTGRGEAGWPRGLPPSGRQEGAVKPQSGLGSWFSDRVTASGVSAATTEGIALPSRAGLKQMFRVTGPDGRTFDVPQIDTGPAAWTGRGIDISKPLAERMGADPTDQRFTWERLDRALAAQTAQKVEGTGRITVDVTAPKGTKVDAKGGGMFTETQINRSQQMGMSDDVGLVMP